MTNVMLTFSHQLLQFFAKFSVGVCLFGWDNDFLRVMSLTTVVKDITTFEHFALVVKQCMWYNREFVSSKDL